MESKFKSRKFLVAVVTILSIFITAVTGIELPEEQIDHIVKIAMVFLGGQSVVDSVKEFKRNR